MASVSLVHLVYRGTFGGSQTFSWRVTLAGPVTASQTDLDGWLATAAGDFATLMAFAGGPKTLQSTTDPYVALNAYFLPVGQGTAALSSQVARTDVGTAARTLPYQVS